MSIGENILRARLAAGLTQRDLAAKLNISFQAIQKYEKGIVTNIPIERIQQLADVLNVSPLELLDIPPIPEISGVVEITGVIPVYGTIAAGVPVFEDNVVIDHITTTHKHPSEYFGLKVKGSSMINAGITDGAYVTVHKQNTAENGDIVACRVNGDEATLKRFRQQGSTVLLMPENPDYEPIILSARDFSDGTAEIIGVATDITQKL